MKEQAKLTSLALVYGVVISVCYLMGFWRTFNINVFQYADITDVLKAAILPLSFSLLGAGLTYVFMDAPRLIAPPINPTPPGPRWSRAILFIARWKELAIILWVGVASLCYQLIHEPWKWAVLIVACAPFVALIADVEALSSIIPNTRLRRTLVFFAAPIPFTALFGGSFEAHKILDQHADYIVEASSLNLPKISTASANLEYIGLVGSTFFLYDAKSNGLLLLKQSDSLALQLLPNPAKR